MNYKCQFQYQDGHYCLTPSAFIDIDTKSKLDRCKKHRIKSKDIQIYCIKCQHNINFGKCEKCHSIYCDCRENFTNCPYKKRYQLVNSRITERIRSIYGKCVSSYDCEMYLGINLWDYQTYIESHFTQSMNWNNWGQGINKWSIDHIKPLKPNYYIDNDELKERLKYTNTIPLNSISNIKKSNKIKLLLKK